MSNLNVFNQSWNEIVFEGRNKEYGAYQLRHENPKTTLKALLYGTVVCCLLVSIPLIADLLKDEITTVEIDTPELAGATYVELERLPEKKPEKAATVAEPEKSSAKEEKYVIPTVVDKPNTTSELPTLDPKETIKTGSTDNPGDGEGKIAIGEGSATGTGDKPVENSAPKGGGDEIYNNVQSKPEFPGGIKNFLALVGKRFKTNDVDKEGVMKIFVYFVVEKDGTLSNIKVLRDPGYGLGNEAIRVLKSIQTKWKPGIQNDKPVRTAYNLPISVDIKNN